MGVCDKIKKYFDGFVAGLNAAGCVLIMFIMLLVVCDVCGRYFFNHPITGVAEVVVLSIIIIAFFQVPYVQLQNKHLKSTVFYDKMSLTGQHIVDTIGLILGIIIFALLLKSSWSFFIKAVETNEYDGSGSVHITTIPSRIAVVVGSLLMVIIQIRQIIAAWRPKNNHSEGKEDPS